jgi:tetratricopeptide (TPR) repeat protein
MRKLLIMIVFLTAIITAIQMVSYAADELFDTKTATEHLEKGIEHLKAKQYDAAIGEFEESASVNPGAEAFYYLGYAYYMKGRKGDEESRKKSMENFEQAYEIDPNFTPTRFKTEEPLPPRTERETIETRQTQTSDASAKKTPDSTQSNQPSSPVQQPMPEQNAPPQPAQ